MSDAEQPGAPGTAGRDAEGGPHPGPAPTADALRIGIDRGEAGDKLPAPDPAAAPLGTDDEAAGHPPTAGERRRAAASELARPGHRPQPPGRTTPLLALVALAIILLALIGLAAGPR